MSDHGSVIIDPKCGRGIGIDWNSDEDSDFRELNAVADRFGWKTMMVRLRVEGVGQKGTGEHGPFVSLRLKTAKVLEAYEVQQRDENRFYDWRDGPSPEPFQPSS